jgi:hypothetical protein
MKQEIGRKKNGYSQRTNYMIFVRLSVPVTSSHHSKSTKAQKDAAVKGEW